MISVNRMDKEFINSLPIIRFKGEIKIIKDQIGLNNAAKLLSDHTQLGFDTESRPSFKKGTSYPISVVQLATEEICYLFLVSQINNLTPLAKILSNKKIQKIGIDSETDLIKLNRLITFQSQNFFDLSKMAEKKGIIQFGVRNLAARYLGQRVSKNCRTSNWARINLLEKQQVYAATDAWICLKIHPLLLMDNTDYSKIE